MQDALIDTRRVMYIGPGPNGYSYLTGVHGIGHPEINPSQIIIGFVNQFDCIIFFISEYAQ